MARSGYQLSPAAPALLKEWITGRVSSQRRGLEAAEDTAFQQIVCQFYLEIGWLVSGKYLKSDDLMLIFLQAAGMKYTKIEIFLLQGFFKVSSFKSFMITTYYHYHIIYYTFQHFGKQLLVNLLRPLLVDLQVDRRRTT